MIVVVNGRMRRFVGASLNGKLMTEWRLGEKIMWPNPEGVARRILVELPQEGTLDWQYWVHAADATQGSVSRNNYMKFVCDGVDYFINGSYDGTPPYKLEDNVLTLDVFDGAAIDRLGTHLEVEAKIAARDSYKYELVTNAICSLPYLMDTKLYVNFQKGRKRKASGCSFRVVGESSGVVHFGGSCYASTHDRDWHPSTLPDYRGKYWLGQQYNNAMMAEDSRLLVTAKKYSDTTYYPSVILKWPAFTRKFKLKIITVS
ncbi:MAG: hypothetical protein IKZ07_05515 [Akkermansia sp.]|nr:hypothetical protein [Akkermansia sp.]